MAPPGLYGPEADPKGGVMPPIGSTTVGGDLPRIEDLPGLSRSSLLPPGRRNSEYSSRSRLRLRQWSTTRTSWGVVFESVSESAYQKWDGSRSLPLDILHVPDIRTDVCLLF